MLIRWLLFLMIGLPFQGVVYLLYPFLALGWFLFVYKPVNVKQKPKHQYGLDVNMGKVTYMNGSLLQNADDHGAFTQYGFIQKEGLELLQKDGNLIRRLEANGEMNRRTVSGDVVVAWFFANSLSTRPASDDVMTNIADQYMKNLGTLSYDEVAQGYVSTRCANFGINEAKDSDIKISQPQAGPQFYTTSAVLASVYNKGFKYKAMFWAHWVLMGGWYWAVAPVLYPDQKSLWYVRDITMKSLYIHLQVFGPKWWITRPMEFINDATITHENDLFNAMMDRQVGELPEIMSAFFSQREDASSVEDDRMSSYIPEAIRKIKRETRFKE